MSLCQLEKRNWGSHRKVFETLNDLSFDTVLDMRNANQGIEKRLEEHAAEGLEGFAELVNPDAVLGVRRIDHSPEGSVGAAEGIRQNERD